MTVVLTTCAVQGAEELFVMARVMASGVKREKGKDRLQGRHCFLHFSRSDSERENRDWSELIKCQSST